MAGGAQRAELAGGRWHWQHGPIDLVIGADGDPAAVAHAHQQAWARFEQVLPELVAELGALRQPVGLCGPGLLGPIARCMQAACLPLLDEAQGFITPMAAVAGAVAQDVAACYAQAGVQRAWVNNGGDIALYLTPGTHARVGLVADLQRWDGAALARTSLEPLRPDAGMQVHHADPVRGVATSGWPGRSHSLGIADSVTVLAATAAQADAAATVVANAVNVDHPGIRRAPASSLRDDSDLGERLVTVAVPPLPEPVREQALQAGLACAQRLQARGLLHAAVLVCQGSLARLMPAQPLQSAVQLVQ